MVDSSQDKNLDMSYWKKYSVFVLVVASTVLSCVAPTQQETEPALDWVHAGLTRFAAAAENLDKTIASASKNRDSLPSIRKALIDCRLAYKQFAFFLEYYFPEKGLVWNGPPVMEVEANQELRDPSGLQLIEQLLYEDAAMSHLDAMSTQAKMLKRSAEQMIPLLQDFVAQKGDVIGSFRVELIRIITLYITGFDAPQLKTGIRESAVSVATMDSLLQFYARDYPGRHILHSDLQECKKYLDTHTNFDDFDRLLFITRFMQPLELHLERLMNSSQPPSAFPVALNTKMKHLFEPDALSKSGFPHEELTEDKRVVTLGKKLFFDNILSGNQVRSCASCHMPEAFFTDRLARNKELDGKTDLSRNTPSLLYSGYQHAQFWDGRVQTLEQQVNAVLTNVTEMNTSNDTLLARLRNRPEYVVSFRNIWPKDSTISYSHMAGAIASYIRTLSPFTSAFDRYMQGDRAALSDGEKKGFNIFMGKALCGTCHFAPIFNGLMPPDFATSEFEILGTPATDDLRHPGVDPDPGRYAVQPGPASRGAFKTPTVRNSAVTAPYMHNGRFASLEKVVEFYDLGGGQGIGLATPDQTLPADSLHLTNIEKANLVLFLKALSDK